MKGIITTRKSQWLSEVEGKAINITKWLRLGGTSGSLMIHPPYSSRATELVSQHYDPASKEADSNTSPGNLYQWLSHLHSAKGFCDVQTTSPVFQFVTLASGPVNGHILKESDSVLFSHSFQVIFRKLLS